MSIKHMALVWDCKLEPITKSILIAYADHADSDGGNIYPCVDRVAWKTGYSERTVQNKTKELIDMGILVRIGRGPAGTNKFKIDANMLPIRPPYGGVQDVHPATGGGVQETTLRGAPDDIKGCTSCAPEPSLTIIKSPEKKEGGTTSSFSQFDTSNAISQFGDNSARLAHNLYCSITGQMSIPSAAQSALEDLKTILDYYDHDIARAKESGHPVFAEWCNTIGKSGRKYSAINPGWISKWLERIAPRPEANEAESYADRAARQLGLKT